MAGYIREGAIMKAKPKHFIPRPDSVGHVGYHPVIVLSPIDDQGYVLVTPMSHNHPEGTPTKSASRYGLPIDPVKGESRVSVGYPKRIHWENLKAHCDPFVVMAYDHYIALKTDIFECIRRGRY